MAHAHCTRPGQGPGLGPRTKGFYIMPRTVHTTQGRGKDREPLFSIVSIPVPVAVMVPCSVYEP